MIDRYPHGLRPTSLFFVLLHLVLKRPAAPASRRSAGWALRDTVAIAAATGVMALAVRSARPRQASSRAPVSAAGRVPGRSAVPPTASDPSVSLPAPLWSTPSRSPRPSVLAQRSRLLRGGRRRAIALAVAGLLTLAVFPPGLGSHVTLANGSLSSLASRTSAPVPADEAWARPTLDPGAAAAGALAPDAALPGPAAPPQPGGRGDAGLVAAAPYSRLLRPLTPAAGATQAAVIGGGSTSGARVMTGWASWYDNGTTAMRLPRGSRVLVCGPAACVSRTVTDYGPDPSIYPGRIVDMMPADFAAICGCPASRGTAFVTVTLS